MSNFIFKFLISDEFGGTPLTDPQLNAMKTALESMIRDAVRDDTTVSLSSLRFYEGPDKVKMIIVEGTTSDLEDVRGNVDWPIRYLEEDKVLPQGWTITDYSTFISNVPDAERDPEVPEAVDEDPAGGRRRRSSSKRVRKVTRRRRHRKGSRKLRSKLL
jgi:hypothetical protein